MPLHRAVTRVRLLPETEAWAARMQKAGAIVQYIVLLQEPVRAAGRCYWTVDTSAGGRAWRRFYVSPDGKHLLRRNSAR